MSPKKRLLIVVNQVSFFLSHRKEIGLEAQRRGYHVVVVGAVDVAEDELDKALGIRFINLGTQRSGTIGFSDLIYSLRLSTIIRLERPDVVHLITIKPILIGGVVCRALRVRAVVYAVSGLGSVFVGQSYFRRIRRLIVRSWYRFVLKHKNMRVILQNDWDLFILTKFSGLAEKNVVRLTGSGVDLARFHPGSFKKSAVISVLFAGRLLKEKGILEFVEAAKKSRDLGFNIRFIIAGTVDQGNPSSVSSEELVSFSENFGVELVGYINDMATLLREVDIFCYPSFYGEGIPKVLLEAAASGLPIITTDHPGCRDTVEPGVSGILVPPHSGLAVFDAILELAADDEKRERFSIAGRLKAEREFAVEYVVEKHLETYHALLIE